MRGIALKTCGALLILAALVRAGDPPKSANTDKTPKSSAELYGGKSLSQWIQTLNDRDPEVRRQACYPIAHFGSHAQPVIPALSRALADSDEQVRACAAMEFRFMAPDAVAAMPALYKALEDPFYAVREDAFVALAKIGPESRTAVARYVPKLTDEDGAERAHAARVLGEVRIEPEIVLPALASALRNEKEPCRHYGSMAFYAHPDVMRSMAESLSRFGPDAIPYLQKLLDEPSDDVRWCALYGLGEIGPAAKPAMDAIGRMIKSKDKWVRALVATDLIVIGADPDKALPPLIEALKDQSGMVRRQAAESLAKMGRKACPAVPALLAAFRDRDVEFSRSDIGEALKQIDPVLARSAGVPD
jgi:HEAT repeat protein